MNGEAYDENEPMMLEYWLAKRKFPAEASSYAPAPPADALAADDDGINCARVSHESKTVGH